MPDLRPGTNFTAIVNNSGRTKNVADYELVIGNPARHGGWMSEYGHKLSFDKDGIAVCPESRQEYKLENGKVTKTK